MFIVQQTGKMYGNDKIMWLFRSYFRNAIWEYITGKIEYRGAEVKESVRKMETLPFAMDKWEKTTLDVHEWLRTMEAQFAIATIQERSRLKQITKQQVLAQNCDCGKCVHCDIFPEGTCNHYLEVDKCRNFELKV